MFFLSKERTLLVVAFASVCLTVGAQQKYVERMVVNDGRPVYTAIRELEKRYGWYMTYEDPPYEHSSELRDATHPDYKRSHPNEAPIFLPKEHHLEFTFSIPTGGGDPDLRETLDALYASHKESGNPGFFADDHVGAIVHVHPVRVKKRDGQLLEFRSIMETPVNFPKEQRNAFQTLEIVLSQVSENSHQHISMGNVPTNGLRTASGEHGADNRPARDVLIEVFEDINRLNMGFFNHPAHIVWDLLYDPTFKGYAFNAHFVVVEKKGAFGATVREPR